MRMLFALLFAALLSTSAYANPQKVCLTPDETVARIQEFDKKKGVLHDEITRVTEPHQVAIVYGALEVIFDGTSAPTADSYVLSSSDQEINAYVTAFNDGCRVYGQSISKKNYDAIMTTLTLF